MKINSSLKKSVSLMLSLSMLSACSITNKESSNGDEGSAAELITKTNADKLYTDWLYKVTKGEISFLAAEALVPSLKQKISETGEPITVSVVSQESFDLAQFRRQIVKKQNQAIQKMMMAGENVLTKFEDELHLTLPFQINTGSYSVLGLDRLVDLGILREESKRRLEAVFKVYDDAAKQAAQAEALKRIEEAKIEAEIAGLEGLGQKEKDFKIKDLIASKKLDQIAATGKSDIDVIVKKYLYDAVYELLINHTNLKNTIHSTAIAAHTYEQLVKTAQAFASFRDSVQNTWADIKSAQLELSNGLQQVRGRIKDYNLEELIRDPSALEEWKKAVAEGKNLIEGEVDSENPTANQASVSEAYKKAKASSQKLAKNTRALADSGQMLVDAGKLFLDEETVRKAQTIVDGVNKVSLIMDKLSTGGVTGVISAVGIAMGGVGGGMDVAGARHSELSGKLDAILKNQKLMIDLQIETIQLQKKTLQAIADMAQMIDNNHRVTMARLDGIDAQLATLTEILQANNMTEFYTCDRLLYGNAVEDQRFRLGFMEKSLSETLQSLSSIEALLGKTDQKEDYSRCRRGAQDLFLNEGQLSVAMSYGANINSGEVINSMSGLINEGMIRLFPIGNLYKQKYQKGLGDPLSKFRALHVPAKYMSLVPVMDQLYSNQNSRADEASDGSGYLLTNRFLNPNMVMNQTRALLVVTKLISVLGDGNWSAQNPLKVGDTDKIQKELQSAHHLVQSAIAQEALMSGEPILGLLYDRINSLIANPATAEATLELKSDNCVSKEDFGRIGCLFSKNPILKRNFVQYFLHRRFAGNLLNPNDILQNSLGAAGQVSYRALYLEAQNFRSGVPSSVNLQQLGNLSYSKTSQVPALKIGDLELNLPTVEEYQEDLIQYSLAMKELLLLQKDLIQTRIKLENMNLTEQERQILAEFLFQSVQ